MIYRKVALLNPRIEVKLRQIYCRNSKMLSRFNPNINFTLKTNCKLEGKVDFNRIINQLKEWGVKEGSLLIVHSSYDNLRVTGLSPLEIIAKLR